MNKLIFASIALIITAAPALAAPKPIPVPEPSSLSLLASGAAMLGGLKFFRGRRRQG
jgi:hypothetical protein